MLLKVALFIFVGIWILRGAARFFLGNLVKQAQRQQQEFHQQRNTSYRQPTDGNVNVRVSPQHKNKKSSENFKGGDYVDYEEVD